MNKKTKPNLIDKLVSSFSPEKGLKRAIDRERIANFYEAAKPSKDRPKRTDRGSGDTTVARAGDSLRIQARHLDDNHDLASGVLDVLVNKTIGRGLRYEPQVRDASGELHDDFNQLLFDIHERFSEAPEVTRELSRSEMERLEARTWFRDGEAFKVYHAGNIPNLKHSTKVPLSFEVFEPDYCPLLLTDEANKVRQGVQKNGWGQPVNYFFFKSHPGDLGTFNTTRDYKAVPAFHVNHLKQIKRLGQTRGVSVFASVMTRLDDLKDFEEAERVAARIAAKMVLYVKKGDASMYGSDDFNKEEREHQVYENGMSIFDMEPGSEMGSFDHNRPHSGMGEFRDQMMKATSAGTGAGASSISKNYNGSYASRRMEVADQQENYSVLTDVFIRHSAKPDYRRFIDMAILSGVDVPADIDMDSLYDVEIYGAHVPYADPDKESKSDVRLINNNLDSVSSTIRRRGRNPLKVFNEVARDKRVMKKLGISVDEVTKKI